MSSETKSSQALKTGVEISSEILVPGGSNLVKGDFRQAGIHAGLGFMAKILFGVPGVVLVSANSISKAVTGRHLYEHLTGRIGTQARSSEAKAAPPETVSQSASVAPANVPTTSAKSSPITRQKRTKPAAKSRKTSGSKAKA